MHNTEYIAPETVVLDVDVEGVLCESNVGAQHEGYTQGQTIDI